MNSKELDRIAQALDIQCPHDGKYRVLDWQRILTVGAWAGISVSYEVEAIARDTGAEIYLESVEDVIEQHAMICKVLEADRTYEITPLIEQKKVIANLITLAAEYSTARALYGLPPIETPASTYEFAE